MFLLFYFLISPVLLIIIYITLPFNKKIRVYLNKKNKTVHHVVDALSKINRKEKKVLLFHAASAGEFEQIKPILNQINRKKYFIIQTFTSPTIYNVAHNNSLFDVCCYHPLDVIWQSYSFFKKVNPDAYIVTRHDIWPSHLFITRKLNIKSYYINANLHKKSIWIKKILLSFSKSVFNYLDFCLVPSENIKNKFLQITSKQKIHITGDSRFDQILNRKNCNQDLNFLPSTYDNSFNIIFGSYDEYDVPIMIDSLINYYPNGAQSLKDLGHKIILVPHEIHEKDIQKTAKKLQRNQFKTILYSEIDFSSSQECSLLIVDKVGILADLYKHTQLAYIGSGFYDGVHSVIEPAVYGNAVSFGPNIELLDEAKHMYHNQLGFMIKDKNDMMSFFDLHKQKTRLNQIHKDVIQYVNHNANASEKIIHFIERTI